MAAPVGSLVVRVGSDIRGLTSGLQTGARKVEDFGRTANKVAQRDFRKLQKELAESGKQVDATSAAFSKFARVGPLIGVAFGVKAVSSIVRTADSYTQLQNRLRAVTDSSEELERVQGRLFDISRDTRSAVESNVELFGRLRLATKDLGTSEEEILNFTESLNQAIKLSGASAAEAQAGILQLAQGMASGTLRGDELRSVLEQLPAVADVIAKSLGVTRGQLRQMGTDGEITADVILKAFREARGELADQFRETVPTVAESVVQLQNSLLKLGGTFSQVTGLGENLPQALSNIAESIDKVSTSAASRFLKDLPDILGLGLDALGVLPVGLEPRLPETLPLRPPPQVPSVIVPDESIQNAVQLRLLMEGVATFGNRATEAFSAMSEVAGMAASTLSPLGEAVSSVFQIPPAEELQAEAERRLEVIRQAGLSEEELAQEQFEKKLATLEEQFGILLISEEDFMAQREALTQDHEDRLADIRQRSAERQRQIEEATSRFRIAAAFSVGQSLLSIAESAAKDNFHLQKAIAIAQGVLSAAESIVTSYAHGSAIGGPALGATFAKITAVAQAANLAAITAAQFVGGRGGGAAKPTAAAAPVPGPPGGGGAGGGGGGGGGRQTVNIALQGDRFGQQQVRELIEQINEALDDGARLRVV